MIHHRLLVCSSTFTSYSCSFVCAEIPKMIQINIKVAGLNESLLVSGRTMSGQEGLVLVLKEHHGEPLLIYADRRRRFPPHSDRRQPFSPQIAVCHQRIRGRRDSTSLRRPACSTLQKNAVSNYLERTFQRGIFSDKPVLQLQHRSCRCQSALMGLHLFALTLDHLQIFFCDFYLHQYISTSINC